jgi:hypothetical protein
LSPLSAWETFYVIIGSSAAALTGLQFVVIVLGAEVRGLVSAHATRAFATPTIVHFAAVLLLSAILTAPWPALSTVALAVAVCGGAGIAYTLMVIRHMRHQTVYAPVLEDWTWHGALPLVAYVGLLVSAAVLRGNPVPSLFAIGGSAVLLLFVGIHNAWDAVTYMALQQALRERDRSEEPPQKEKA